MAVSTDEPSRWPVGPPGGGEWTVDLLDQLPDDNLKFELLDGILLVSPAPIPRHQRAILRLAMILTDVCPADHEVFVAPLDWRPDKRTSLEPDLMVVAKDRIGEKNIQENPAIVVEVLSPSSRRYDRLLKFGRYAEAGIPQYWIVDPGRPSVEVYDLVDRGDDQGVYRLTGSAEGDAHLTIAAPLAVTVTPSALVSA
ncbi:MAG TPA: Uma2 family endonuclease [Nakamurella sp.]